ncbi:MAG: hypothetical protein J7K71_01540 [Candidatus Omnitrophica bacterium]|nr:hypothetical protein [Candidatus Omnitrophota bacterium]
MAVRFRSPALTSLDSMLKMSCSMYSSLLTSKGMRVKLNREFFFKNSFIRSPALASLDSMLKMSCSMYNSLLTSKGMRVKLNREFFLRIVLFARPLYVAGLDSVFYIDKPWKINA